MRTTVGRTVTAALLCFTISGCAYLNMFLNDAVTFLQPNFNFKEVKLTDFTLGGLNLDTVWTLQNPANVGISLASVDYGLFVEEKQVVSGKPQNGLQLAPSAASDLHFPAAVKFIDVVQVLETFLTKDVASYRAEGGIGVQTPVGIVRFPIAKNGTFEVPKIPAIVFGNPRVSGVTFAGATFEFPLTVTNKNNFPLPVSGVVGNVSVGGAPIGTLGTGNLGEMTAKGTRTVNIPLNVSFLAAGGALLQAAQGGNAQVKFDAHVESGAEKLPIKVEQLVSFLK